MDLVIEIAWRRASVSARTAMGGVAPVVVEPGRDHGGHWPAGARPRGERVGLERQERAVGADDLVFIGQAGMDPGMKISQIPVSRRRRVVWRLPSQPLKSPTTRRGGRCPDPK